jgi:hypothetical protein
MDKKPKYLDYYLNRYRWYRKLSKGMWYKHRFTKDAEQLTFAEGGTWWARYGKINRYSNVTGIEVY